ncbi:flagellar motor protein MotB [Kushneria aurantia]|uniref:Flagellar motor protein MotB n=1 Tax=Kushneria aurantia TaxID=504092 RepID=A0ABV6G185_9GAMM|nr:flagellar motor protein MotB [Kushneria aurantia]
MSQNRRPVVVRRKKVVGHTGSHGTWKIAYADFMTAMMAFFLVMWLISSASEDELKTVSEYFNMPLSAAFSSGEKVANSPNVIPGGGDDPMQSDGSLRRTDLNPARVMPANGEALSRLKQRLEVLIQEDPALRVLRSQIRLELTPEGLRIQLVDSQRRPMFELGSARLEPHMHRILTAFAPLLNELPNGITLSGHTDDLQYATGASNYSNWELSTDRANAARRDLVRGGLDPSRLMRVIGMADAMPLADEPGSPLNRRISILVLNQQAQQRLEEENSRSGEPIFIDSQQPSQPLETMIRGTNTAQSSGEEGSTQS